MNSHHYRIRCTGRRNFLRTGVAGMAGLTLSHLLKAQEEASDDPTRNVENVIMVWLAGGPATIDMWDLKPDAPENIRGPFQQIDTNVDGVQISEHMPRLAQTMDQCTLIRSVNHSIPAHGPGTQYVQTGNKPSPAVNYPSLGSIVSKLAPAPDDIPAYVTFRNNLEGATAGYLGPAYNPYTVQGNGIRGLSLPRGVSPEEFSARTRLLESFDYRFSALDDVSDVVRGMDKFQQRAIEILRSDRTRLAFDLGSEPAEVRQAYGNSGLGRNALIARRLIESGVRFVTISTGGWDTHGDNFNNLRNRLLPPLDVALAALVGDLRDKGMLEKTLVYCTGEFGRTPRINGNSGRDHWARSMSVLLAGGGFPRGSVYGSTTDDGQTPEEKACTPDDISATIVKSLGLDPNVELQTPSGRPMKLFREGRVLDDLLT